MTISPSQPEPLSVRVARAKGCEPQQMTEYGSWWCECADFAIHVGAPETRLVPGRMSHGLEAWLTPAASFSLLAEMVSGSKDEQWVEFGEDENGFWCQVCDKTCNSYGPLVSESGGKSLEEAVALAYLALLAWKAAQS